MCHSYLLNQFYPTKCSFLIIEYNSICYLYASIPQNVFPVEYGPDFDTALETLVCEFFTRLEELLPIPDFKQVQKRNF